VLVVPVALPLLLGASQTLEAARYGREPWSWLLLILTVDLVAAVATGFVARHLEESA
jgi:heme exporter protein B